MKKLLFALGLLLLGAFGSGVAHACNVPNPNLNAPPFVDGCPVPASALNKLANTSTVYFNVVGYGAVGNDSIDDSAAIAKAFAACSAAGGGLVYFPPTGSAYLIAQANLPAAAQTKGCKWFATAGHGWPNNFYDNTPTDWYSSSGAWIHCTDTVNQCATVQANGGGVVGLNFWQTQPTPSSTTCSVTPCAFGTGWTPSTMPAIIGAKAGTTHWDISDNQIVNAYQCLDIEGPSSGIGNFFSRIEHNALGCFKRDALIALVDNNLVWNDNHQMLLWFQGSTQVLGYDETQGIGLDIRYWANPYILNSDMTWRGIGIQLTDATVTNGFGSLTFASANMQMVNVQFNEVCQAMVAPGSTHFAGGPAGNAVGNNILSNIYATVDSQTTGTPAGGSAQCAQGKYLFQFGDNSSVTIDGLNVGYADGIAQIGTGTNGYLAIKDVRAQQYGAYTATQAAFNVAANAVLNVPGNLFSVAPSASPAAGPEISGSGTLYPFDVPGQLSLSRLATTGTAQMTFCTLPATGNLGTGFGCPADYGIRSQNTGGHTQLNFDLYSAGTYSSSPLVMAPTVSSVNGKWNVTGLSGAGASAGTTVCVDASGNLLTKAGAC